ncbi:hypothetical protein AVEN_143908-1 [Araneus ventricosus]|uniref:Uncharacterized protein n=1 Tax=Araneus ventricosus TaxID=182803 RepID=A0A4Y2ENE8_ARAVE|nr:hypothetical protein AVEN_143908-1 [Araneus ventricosus]
MRSHLITKRTLASPGSTIMVGLCYLLHLPPSGGVGPWTVMAIRTLASVLELLQRLSFTGPWMSREDRSNTAYGYGYLNPPGRYHEYVDDKP